MSSLSDQHSIRANRTVVVAGALLLLVGLLGVWMVFRFVNSERERELQQWQIRLGIVAESRAAAVADWVETQFGTLTELAENASLQIYLTELMLVQGDRGLVTDESAQAQFLSNLLTATAERGGFEVGRESSQVAANVERPGLAGLMLTDAGGRPVVATAGMPPLSDAMRGFIAGAEPGKRAMMDLFPAANGAPAIAFLVPVFAIQGDRAPSDLVGLIVGVRLVDAGLFKRLQQPGEALETAETYLVRRDGAVVTYLSPLADGTAPLSRMLSTDTPELAAAALLDRPGGFGVLRNYRGAEVLATSRSIAGTDWTLLRSVDRKEAQAAADRRLTILLVILLLAILVVAVAIIAVWRHGTSLRSADAAERYRRSTERFQSLSKFLRVVTDGQPTAIFAVDRAGRYSFANAQAAREAGMEPEDMLGKSLASVLGAAYAGVLEPVNREVLESDRAATEWHDLRHGPGRRLLKTDHIPLAGDANHDSGVLIISEDITALEEARERRARTLRELVSTCVAVVDRRDPFSANHSARVAEVARAIAEAMRMSPVEVETCDIAGALMNLGKVLVPEEVLTKTERLTDQELEMIRQSVQTSAELIQGVDFDGPVYDTIRQIQEHWDGGGKPQGLAGEDIVPTARVVAVANAFVALVSARAYRTGMGFDKAAEILLGEAGRTFDRRPVMALLNYLDNLGGREQWANFGDLPGDVAA